MPSLQSPCVCVLRVFAVFVFIVLLATNDCFLSDTVISCLALARAIFLESEHAGPAPAHTAQDKRQQQASKPGARSN